MIALAALKLWPWKLIGKVAGIAVVVGLLLWLILQVLSWRDDSHELPKVEAERDAAIAETARVKVDWDRETSRLQKINEGLTDENQTLRAVRAAVPVRSVRLCPEETRTVPRDSAPTSRDDAPPAGAGVLPPEARPDPPQRPDIGPDLFALADAADEQLRLYRGLQDYVRGLPKECAIP